jgi:hypothetical protein
MCHSVVGTLWAACDFHEFVLTIVVGNAHLRCFLHIFPHLFVKMPFIVCNADKGVYLLQLHLATECACKRWTNKR